MADIPILGEKKDKPVTIMIGIPYYSTISTETIQGVMNLCSQVPFYWVHYWHATTNVVSGRNLCMETFIADKESDYLMFIDSDMTFKTEDFLQVFEALQLNPDAGLCGGMYIKRDSSLTPLISPPLVDGKPPEVDDHIKWLQKYRGEVVEAGLIPTGFMLIRREAAQAVVDAQNKKNRDCFYLDWPWADDPDPFWSRQMWTSDNVFVNDVRKQGFLTLAHLGVELGHIGRMTYLPDHFYATAEQHTTDAQLGRVKLAALTAFGVNTQKYWDSLYTFEIQSQHTRDYPELHKRIIAAVQPGAIVLDVGSGPGVLASKLEDEVNAKVVVTDFSLVALEEAINKYNLPGFQWDIVNDQVRTGDHGHFDYVIATQVLEHLEDPAAALKKLYAMCKPGGTVIVSVPDNCLPPEEEPDHVQCFTPAAFATLLQPLEGVDIQYIDTQPFPKLLGIGTKPKKKRK